MTSSASPGLGARLALAGIGLYQRFLSPVLPAVFGSACGCRFSPTCSHYAAEAVRTHGLLAGGMLALLRLLKCTPLHPGGFDAVPRSLRSLPRQKPECRASPPAVSAR